MGPIHQGHVDDDEDTRAIKHVFITILQMDQPTFQKVQDWLSSHGAYSLAMFTFFGPDFVQDPNYEVNGETAFLDSWIIENFTSICSFAIWMYK